MARVHNIVLFTLLRIGGCPPGRVFSTGQTPILAVELGNCCQPDRLPLFGDGRCLLVNLVRIDVSHRNRQGRSRSLSCETRMSHVKLRWRSCDAIRLATILIAVSEFSRYACCGETNDLVIHATGTGCRTLRWADV